MGRDRDRGVTVALAQVGQGTVMRSIPPEDLITPDQTGLVKAPGTPTSSNVRLYDGLATRRPGLASIGAVADSDPVLGLFMAEFASGSSELIRVSNNASTTFMKYDSNSSGWDNISGGRTSSANVDGPWSAAMCPVPGAGGQQANALLMGSPRDPFLHIWRGYGTVDVVTDVLAPTYPHVIREFLNRAFVFNVVDQSTGLRQATRIAYSIIGNCTNFTGLGSGVIDLTEDPYPIVAASIVGGRLAVYKGGPNGGAVYACTATGVSTAPIRADAINPRSGVGVLIPRSVVSITPGVDFFLGHDAAYLYDGARALLPFAQGTVREFVDRLDLSKLNRGFSTFDRETGEVEVHVVTTASADGFPDESWVFDTRARRVSGGPHVYPVPLTAGVEWLAQNNVIWDHASGIWSAQTVAWEDIGGAVSNTRVKALGDNDGVVYSQTEQEDRDASDNISCTWLSPAITPEGWSYFDTQGRPASLREDDVLVLREIKLRHRSESSWTPVVEHSTDGTTWTVVSDGNAVAATNGRMLTKTYYAEAGTSEGVWHQLRVKNTNGDAFNLHSLVLEFTYAGSSRHE